MTQQPDPFSELRGFMERSSPGMMGMIVGAVAKRVTDARGTRGEPETVDAYRLVTDLADQMPKLGALLDERDRLISQVDELLALQAEDDASFRNTEARALSAEGEVEKLRSALTAISELFALPEEEWDQRWPQHLQRFQELEAENTSRAALHKLVAEIARQALSQEIG